MASNKKMTEVIWLKKFRSKSGLKFEILDGNRERPDFLIKFDGRRVGVEIAELQVDQGRLGVSKGSKMQKEHGIRAEIVERAQKRYFELGYRSLNAKFLFEPQSDSLSTIGRSELARTIVDDVLGQLHLDAMEKCRLDRYSDPPVPPPVSVIRATGLPEGIEPNWQVIDPGWSHELQPGDLKPTLLKKNQLVDQYRKAACENWLLIVADGIGSHGRFRLPMESCSAWPESRFERTYVLCEPDRFLIQFSGHGWDRVA